jgi:hypothetical protein
VSLESSDVRHLVPIPNDGSFILIAVEVVRRAEYYYYAWETCRSCFTVYPVAHVPGFVSPYNSEMLISLENIASLVVAELVGYDSDRVGDEMFRGLFAPLIFHGI